jgi:hypothetical protein
MVIQIIPALTLRTEKKKKKKKKKTFTLNSPWETILFKFCMLDSFLKKRNEMLYMVLLLLFQKRMNDIDEECV